MTTRTSGRPVTTDELARRLGVGAWRIQRLIKAGAIPEPPRLGTYRLYDAHAARQVERVLRDRGYIE